jgi:hypothetical protein
VVTLYNEIEDILVKYGIRRNMVHIHEDGVVDVLGDVTLRIQTPRFEVQFGHIAGNFSCAHGKLESLQGSPHTVDGYFICNHNKITSLEGAPQRVGKHFACARNQLTSLKGATQQVGESFYCGGNQLENLLGMPSRIHGKLACYENPLTSLEGMASEGVSELVISYDPHLPLLRVLQAKDVRFEPESGVGSEVEDILHDPRWLGHGKSKAMLCAAELLRAGYKGNARW